MASDVDWSGYLNDPDIAAHALGGMLHRGELALFLGAGVSKDVGAPTWHTLARAMARDSKRGGGGINRVSTPAGELGSIFSQIKRMDPRGFDALVKKWLYFRWTKREGNWASDVLVALGSLMCGSDRGRIDTVLSLNFDSVLEMYLRLYGYIPQAVTTYPSVLRRADVHIFHSHGYLPFDPADGYDTNILLSAQSYFEAIGETENPGRKMMEYVFGSKRILAVGLSGDDIYSRAIIAALAKRTRQGPLMGFWTIGPRDSAEKAAALKDSKMAAVRLSSFSKLPEFIFSIARHAATLMKR